MKTKWEILTERVEGLEERLALEKHRLEALENTPCNITCACGHFMATEADFAKHFVIPDQRYLNLGNCPILDKENNNE